MAKELLIFTTKFPYGKGETFVQTELKYLSKYFKSVIILPLKGSGNETEIKETPPNSNIHFFNLAPINSKVLFKSVVKSPFLFFNILIQELFVNPKIIALKLKHFKKLIIRLSYAFVYADRLKQQINFNQNNVYYSFWMNENATALAILKKKGYIDKFMFRVHGYDFYDERSPIGFIPFRHFNIKMCSKVLCISKAHIHYLVKRHKQCKSKFFLSYLGIENTAANFKLKEETTVFKIVSCANLIPLKRVEMLAKVLMNIKDYSIEWTHIGDGESKNSLVTILKNKPASLSVHLKGHLSSHDVFKIYRDNYFDVFVSLSSSEGLPVSIMEAISFGIPIIATNVGGMSEIVADETGILLDADVSVGEVAKLIEKMISSEIEFNVHQRKNIQKFWSERFNIESSISKTINVLNG